MRKEASDTVHAIRAEEWGPGYHIWMTFAALLSQRGPDGTTSLVRVASHLLIILVAVLVIGFSRLKLPSWDFAEVESEAVAVELSSAPPRQEREGISSIGALVRAAVPFTLMAEVPRVVEIGHYTVQPGDTLYAIADRFGISAETVMWANSMEQNPDLLRLDQELTILPVSGVLHTVVQGDTVESIAKKYRVNPEEIQSFEWNQIDPKNPALAVGKQILVPGGSKPQIARPAVGPVTAKAPANAARGKGRFVWPVSGTITQSYRPLHHAVDIGSSTGVPVKASDGGYVIAAGWSTVGYGNYVMIDHGNGYQTLYAHLSKINVKYGQSVAQGTVIGRVGSTGRSTGPHLHFEVRVSGSAGNPFSFLP